MDVKRILPELSVLGLLGATAGVFVAMGPLHVRPELAVTEGLPENILGYTTEEVRHCQNTTCLRPVIFEARDAIDACPRCGGELNARSQGERLVLPKDTGLHRKVYRDRSGRTFSVAIVISGAERSSIHRPEMCLQAAGHRIEETWLLSVPLPDREPLVSKVLDLRHSITQSRHVYAYWFASDEHETSSHWERTWLMAKDNLFLGEAGRWSYVSVQTASGVDQSDTEEILATFVELLMPYITPPEVSVGSASEQDDGGGTK